MQQKISKYFFLRISPFILTIAFASSAWAQSFFALDANNGQNNQQSSLPALNVILSPTDFINLVNTLSQQNAIQLSQQLPKLQPLSPLSRFSSVNDNTALPSEQISVPPITPAQKPNFNTSPNSQAPKVDNALQPPSYMGKDTENTTSPSTQWNIKY